MIAQQIYQARHKMESILRTKALSPKMITLIVAILGWMFDGFEMGLFPLVARSSLIDLLGTTNDADVGPWISWITAFFLVGAASGGVIFGWLGDRIGRTKALAFSILTYSLCTGLCYFARTPLELAFLRFLAALGMGGEWALGVALVMETWPKEKRTLLSGLIGSASHIGFVLVGLLGLYYPVTTESWRSLMIIGVLPGLLTFVIRLYTPESRQWEMCPRVKAPVAAIFSRPHAQATIVAILLAAVVHIGTWGVVYWAPVWVDQMTQGQMPKAKALVQIFCAFGAAIGGFIGSFVGARYGRRQSYALFCFLSLIFCSLLFSSAREFGALFLLTILCVGFATGTFYGWLALCLPELFPTQIRASGQGMAFNAGRIIAALGVLFTGHMVRMLDGSYARAGALTSLVYGVGFLLIWLLPKSDDNF